LAKVIGTGTGSVQRSAAGCRRTFGTLAAIGEVEAVFANRAESRSRGTASSFAMEREGTVSTSVSIDRSSSWATRSKNLRRNTSPTIGTNVSIRYRETIANGREELTFITTSALSTAALGILDEITRETLRTFASGVVGSSTGSRDR